MREPIPRGPLSALDAGDVEGRRDGNRDVIVEICGRPPLLPYPSCGPGGARRHEPRAQKGGRGRDGTRPLAVDSPAAREKKPVQQPDSDEMEARNDRSDRRRGLPRLWLTPDV
jgi:hypothetical protein